MIAGPTEPCSAIFAATDLVAATRTIETGPLCILIGLDREHQWDAKRKGGGLTYPPAPKPGTLGRLRRWRPVWFDIRVEPVEGHDLETWSRKVSGLLGAPYDASKLDDQDTAMWGVGAALARHPATAMFGAGQLLARLGDIGIRTAQVRAGFYADDPGRRAENAR